MRKKIVDKLVAVTFVAMIMLSGLSFLVPNVKADAFNQIPLYINILEGAEADREKIDEIEKKIDDIFKDNGLDWRVTSVIKNDNYPDPDKSKDQPGDVRVDSELEDLLLKGKEEVKDKPGFKFFVVRRILDSNGDESGINGGSSAETRSAAMLQPSGRDPPIGGDSWAHELGHLFGLGHTTKNGSARPTSDLMHGTRSQRTGTNLQGEDIEAMKKKKEELGAGIPSLTDDQKERTFDEYHNESQDTYGDSFYEYTDIQDVYFAFYMLDLTRNFHITTYLGGLIPEGVGLTYTVALDTDNNPRTGGTYEGWNGIDFLIVVDGISPDVEGTLYSYPGLIPITALETRIETQFLFKCPEAPPMFPEEPILDSIIINIPLQYIDPIVGTIVDPINIGSVMKSHDDLGTDTLEIISVPTSPPVRPTLTFDPPIAYPSQTITATGSGFRPCSNVSIIFAHETLTTTFTGYDGDFQATFTIPEMSEGHYMVDAIDDSHQIGVSMFTISTTPTDGVAGSVGKLDLWMSYIALFALIATTATVISIYVRTRRNNKHHP